MKRKLEKFSSIIYIVAPNQLDGEKEQDVVKSEENRPKTRLTGQLTERSDSGKIAPLTL